MPVIVVPRIRTSANLRLRWGEWLGITLFSVAAVSVAIEGSMLAAATAWFGDPAKALLPLPPLLIALFGAALVMRLVEVTEALRPLARGVLAGGMLVTAFLLIRLYVFPHTPAGDWSWLSSFANIFSLEDEQPHAILGMMAMSVAIWIMGERLGRNAGDYQQRRSAFLSFFVILVVAIIFGVFSASGNDQLVGQMAIYLPLYTFLGLLMMGQVRLAELRDRLSYGSASMRRTLRVWRAATVGMALSVVLLVVLLIGVFYNDTFTGFLKTMGAIWANVVDVIATIAGWIGGPIILFFHNLFTPHTSSSTSTTTHKTTKMTEHSNPITHQQATIVYIIFFSIVLLVVVAIVATYISHLRSVNGGEDFQESREALVPETGRANAAVATVADDDIPGTNTVRAAYRDLLRRGAKVGMEREPNETALEYAERLGPALSMGADDTAERDMSALTDAYEEERYGAVAPTPDRFARAQAAVRAIAATFSNLVRPRR